MSSLNDPSLTPELLAYHRTRTVGLYVLIASLTVAYLKFAVAWGWGKQLLINRQYDQYQNALNYWNSQIAAYQAAHPLSDLKDMYPWVALVFPVQDWQAWISSEDGQARTILLNEVDDILQE